MSDRDESTPIAVSTPACIAEVRQRLEQEGHYVTFDGRVTEAVAAAEAIRQRMPKKHGTQGEYTPYSR